MVTKYTLIGANGRELVPRPHTGPLDPAVLALVEALARAQEEADSIAALEERMTKRESS